MYVHLCKLYAVHYGVNNFIEMYYYYLHLFYQPKNIFLFQKRVRKMKRIISIILFLKNLT